LTAEIRESAKISHPYTTQVIWWIF